MKKKIITLGLVGAMMLSLVGCGGSSDTKVIEGSSSSNAAEATTDSTGFVFAYDGMDIEIGRAHV